MVIFSNPFHYVQRLEQVAGRKDAYLGESPTNLRSPCLVSGNLQVVAADFTIYEV